MTTYDNLETGRAWLTLEGYADHIGKTPRTIMRWLSAGELPDAKKINGAWCIPMDAQRADAGTVVAMTRQMTPEPVTLDALPSFLTIDQAAQVLGISRHAILQRREKFELDTVGPNGSLMMPLATIKKIRG